MRNIQVLPKKNNNSKRKYHNNNNRFHMRFNMISKNKENKENFQNFDGVRSTESLALRHSVSIGS